MHFVGLKMHFLGLKILFCWNKNVWLNYILSNCPLNEDIFFCEKSSFWRKNNNLVKRKAFTTFIVRQNAFLVKHFANLAWHFCSHKYNFSPTKRSFSPTFRIFSQTKYIFSLKKCNLVQQNDIFSPKKCIFSPTRWWSFIFPVFIHKLRAIARLRV
jgi:hypothetical protein